MARVKTFTNGGSLLPGDLNSIEDDYEFAFSTYKDFWTGHAALPAAAGAAATAFLLHEGVTTIVNIGSGALNAAGYVPRRLDPADRTANTRATKYNIRAEVMVGGTAPANTITVGLYPITIAANNFVAGAVQAGSTVAFVTPGANSQNTGVSGAFTAPAAAYYFLGFALSGASAASSYATIRATIQYSQV